MNITYEQLSPSDALKLYGNWILEQQVTEPFPFFKTRSAAYSWYDVFYPLRTLILCGKLFGEKKYIGACIPYMEAFLSEQLPNGGFTAHYRRMPTERLGKKEFEAIMREGHVNLADNGSNVLALMQAMPLLNQDQRQRYLNAARKWFDDWVVIWLLKEGCGNGIWGGKRYGTSYTMAMSNVSSAYSALGLVTGEYEYIEKAEDLMSFQATQWLPDGRPLNLMYSQGAPAQQSIDDYSRIFYLLEGLSWTHFASKKKDVKAQIADRLRQWIFGENGILTQWNDSFFGFNNPAYLPNPGELPSSRLGIRFTWEMAKANGIIHALFYYLDNIEDHPVLREKVNLGIRYLSHPLKARMSGVASDPDESYGAFAVQSTGFAGLSLAQAVKTNVVFEL